MTKKRDSDPACSGTNRDWTGGVLALAGTVVFFLGHGVAFFVHVILPATLALVGSSSELEQFRLSPEVEIGLQGIALLVLLGAWVSYLRHRTGREWTLRRRGIGVFLALISLVVVYQLVRNLISLPEGI